MIRVLSILFGAAFSITTAWSLGMLVLRTVPLPFYAWERRLLAFVTGSACLSGVMFCLCAARLVYRGVLFGLGVGVIGYAVKSGAFRSAGAPFKPLRPLWRWGFIATFAAFSWWAFFNAMAPEHSSDGMAYHLAEVLVYQQAHGFTHITTDVYANLSQGIELLYLFAFEFGRHSAASLVHYSFLVTLVFLVLSFGRRIGKPEAGVAAAIFTYTCPVILRDATTAYIDVALACVLFALFYALQVWDETRDSRLLAPLGILAGFGYAVKYTAFLAVPYTIGFLAWRLWRTRQPLRRPLIIVTLMSATMVAPWMLKDWIEVANPVSPLANRLFPNPYVHISFEDDWRRYLATYSLRSRWEIPLDVTLRGAKLAGFLGPIFLLTPLAILALRMREGRRLLFAALVFEAGYFTNIGTRFLIPMVPFVSLSIALAAASIPWLLTVLTAASVAFCWPSEYRLYSPGAWSLETVPLKAALRLEPEETYLSRDPDYVIVRMIERVVPPRGRIFAIGQGGRSYLRRELLIGYQSASNEKIQDMLWIAVFPWAQPSRTLTLHFDPRQLQKVRVVQAAPAQAGQWSMAEVHVFDGDVELRRNPAWRLTAHPNPWDVELAFDNNRVTRWRTWEPTKPGMYVEADFGRSQRVSAVAVEVSDDSGGSRIKAEGMAPGGKWISLSDRPDEKIKKTYGNLRIAATAELKALGIRYLLIKSGDPVGSDVFNDPDAWGIHLVGQALDARLYYIQ